MSESSNSSNEDKKPKADPKRPRQDCYICLEKESDLRHYESIRMKAQYFTGIIVRVKNLTPTAIEAVLKAIELDNT